MALQHLLRNHGVGRIHIIIVERGASGSADV
jgi:hypothetical protein